MYLFLYAPIRIIISVYRACGVIFSLNILFFYKYSYNFVKKCHMTIEFVQ